MKLLNLVVLAISKTELQRIANPIIDLCDVIVPVLLGVVGAVGAIWCILLGVKYAKADDPQEHEKCKKALINAIIGFVLIFVLLVALEIGVDVFTSWWSSYNG